MKVLHVIPDGQIGGAQEYLIQILKRFSDIHCVACAPDGPNRKRYEQYATAVHLISSMRAGVNPWGHAKTVHALARLVRDGGYNIVHGHTSRGFVLASAVGRLVKRVAVVSSAHGFNSRHNEMNPVRDRLLLMVKKKALQWSDAVVVASESVKRKVLEHGIADGGKVSVIYSGVDFSRFYPAEVRDGGPVVIGAAGRLIPIKGFRYYVEAAAVVLRTHRECRFVLYGEGPEYNRLIAQVESLNISSHFSIMPFSPDFGSVLRTWDIAVIPATTDSFPLTPLEAMATGIPVIATRTGGIPEAFLTGREGMLVDPANVNSLANAISRLVSDPITRHQMGREGLQTVHKHFSWDAVAEQYRHIYELVRARAGG